MYIWMCLSTVWRSYTVVEMEIELWFPGYKVSILVMSKSLAYLLIVGYSSYTAIKGGLLHTLPPVWMSVIWVSWNTCCVAIVLMHSCVCTAREKQSDRLCVVKICHRLSILWLSHRFCLLGCFYRMLPSVVTHWIERTSGWSKNWNLVSEM